MSSSRPLRSLSVLILIAALGSAAFFTKDRWLPTTAAPAEDPHGEEVPMPVEDAKMLKLTPQARKNLGLAAAAARPRTYWKTLQIPGTVVDRPGRTDRGVTSPAVGVVSEVHAFPGETIRPGQRLLTLSLFSEYLQNTQKELFRATRESQIVQEQLDRLTPLAEKGSIPRTNIIELENQLRREAALITSHRQDLLTRGLTPQQIQTVEGGKFVSTVHVVAPNPAEHKPKPGRIQPVVFEPGDPLEQVFAWEVQELNAELGQQVQAGQLLTTLANHQSVYIEGYAFRHDAPYLERAVQNSWPVDVEFTADTPGHWPDSDQTLQIRYLSNEIDADSRTFDFYIPLTNQARSWEKDGESFIVWRYRPGQRVRLQVPVEEMQDVLVVPSAAVVREGPEAYVFQQNGDLFTRLPVHVLHEDRTHIVLANDGSVTPGLYLAQTGAASLNRVMKAQAASGMRADVHVHADGTVHASH